MKKFWLEILELVEDGDADRMIELSVGDLFVILNNLVAVRDELFREREARLAMERALDGLCDRVNNLERESDHLNWVVRDLT